MLAASAAKNTHSKTKMDTAIQIGFPLQNIRNAAASHLAGKHFFTQALNHSGLNFNTALLHWDSVD